MPAWQAEGVVELYNLAEKKDPALLVDNLGTYKLITGKKPTSLKSWIASNIKEPISEKEEN